MSEYEQTLYDKIEGLLIKTRDYPQSETVSQLFADVNRKLDVLIIKTEATHEQACRTNGRVTKCEERLDGIEKQRKMLENRAWGVWKTLSIIGVMFGVIGGFVSGIFQNVFGNIISSKL